MRRGLGHPSRPQAPKPGGKTPARTGRSGGAADADGVLSVGQITRKIKSLLENGVGTVTVRGEISGLKASPSGHVYFCLKDADAVLDCVLWRSSAQRIDSLPREGAKVSARGKLTVYEPRGRYQLVVSAFVADAGAGDLWQKFEALKQKLAAEGLFDPARKRQLPEQPKTVGIVTSRTGAALRDMLKILRRRAPGVTVVVAPTQVQGDSAGAEIVTAIRKLDAWGGADVLIVGRGGGSLEDLWAFNEEQVARAIVNCSIPVVSAVGHETDFTIADFVADARAATPSEAAECVAPDQALIAGRARHAALALVRSLAATIRERRHQLLRLAERGPLRRPLDMVMPKWQRLDDLRSRLDSTIEAKLNRLRNRADMAGAKLDGLSPLAVLSRGYSVTLGPDGKALTDALAVTAGDRLKVLLHRGKLDATVDTAENS